MKGLPRDRFQSIVDQYAGDRYKKKFLYWDHLVVMVCAQFSAASSLRSLERAFNQHENHHYHLHTKKVHRTTLADANDQRDPRIFEEVVKQLMPQARRAMPKSERKELLYLIDSTTIAVRGRGGAWATQHKTRTPGLKLHVQLDSHSQVPVRQSISAANVNDETEGRKIELEAGAIYAFDKGYCNYNWWHSITAARARFVTRLKKNAAYTLEFAREVPGDAENIVSDSVIRLAHKSNRGGHHNKCTEPLRRIEVSRPGDDNLVLVSNDLQSSAAQIAGIYKQRWEIELFFKWIKQHLKIKKFLGESENAIRIQLLTALIAYLLVAILKTSQQRAGTLWELLDELRTGLFLRIREERERWHRRRRQQAAFAALQPRLFS
jgi:hypothetical protein